MSHVYSGSCGDGGAYRWGKPVEPAPPALDAVLRRVVDRYADDPEGWSCGENRTMARMARSLLDAGVAPAIIYDALAAAMID